MTVSNVFRHKQSRRKGQPLSSGDGNNEKAMEIMRGDGTFEQGHRNVKNVWAEA
jgi:hypothetical protein